MSYTVTTTSGTNSYVIPDGTVNTETSVTLIGKNYPNYGAILDQNFLRLLEHSSSNTAPSAPLKGELWWDSTRRILKVWSGTEWRQMGSVVSSSTSPTGQHNVGDLWWDSVNGQLWAYDSNISDFKLVGPVGGTGGVTSEVINDGGGNPHDVVSMSIGGYRYLILSTSVAFTPNPAIPGFQTISPGLNLSNSAFLTNAKFIGQSSDSYSLGGHLANAFMRADTNTTTTGTVSILNNGGLNVGAQNNLKLSVSAPNVAVTSNVNAGTLNFNVRNSSGTLLDAMDIYSNGNVVCNFDLIVAGSAKFAGSDDFVVTATTPSTSTTTGALQVRGGAGIAGNLNVGGTSSNFSGAVTVGSLTASTVAGTLTTAAQTNITSLGTLSSLTVSGPCQLGSVSQVKITGGSNGYYLKTDGAGNLSWASVTAVTDTSQLTNGAGYITTASLGTYLTSESDTLATVTGRGATTSAAISTGAITVTGAITATGDITAFNTSDIRLKKDVSVITDALDKVMQLRGVSYTLNEVGASLLSENEVLRDREVGVIAQEVMEVLPEVVMTRDSGYMAVRYERIIALLIEAIKDLNKKVDDLTKL